MKKYLAIVLILVMALSIAACGSTSSTTTTTGTTATSGTTIGTTTTGESTTGGSEDMSKYSADKIGKKKIGIIPLSLNDSFQVMFCNAAKWLLEDLGHETVIQGSTQHFDAETQVQFIENMIASNYDAILLAPSATDGLITAIRKCEEAGVVLINMDAMLNPELIKKNNLKPVPFAGTDNYEAGRKAGAYAKDNFPKGVKTAILLGVEGHDARIKRYDGFVAGAEGSVNIVAEQTANWDVEQGYKAAQNIITANPDLQLFYCESDGMAVGAARAVEEAKKGDQIKIIGFDAIAEALQLVTEGKILADIAQFSPKIGETSAKLALKVMAGEEVTMINDTGSEVITPDKVAAFNEYLAKYQE